MVKRVWLYRPLRSAGKIGDDRCKQREVPEERVLSILMRLDREVRFLRSEIPKLVVRQAGDEALAEEGAPVSGAPFFEAFFFVGGEAVGEA